MTKPVTLLMALHAHQPVGNFDFVFEEAYARSYEPFLCVLERHPHVRLALHYSGSLIDWLKGNHPEFLERVRRLAERGQVELLASGYYEPILPVIPEADRQGQVAKMRAAIHEQFGTTSTGLWLTERVWEPDLPATLARVGINYTMLDNQQFAGVKQWLPDDLQVHDEAFWDLLGSFVTEYAGLSTRVFPASKRLRYWMPFQMVHRTIAFFKRIKRNEEVAITFADDMEKFGFWPHTFRWVYEEGWLERFFSALEKESSWLNTSTFQDYIKATPPKGSVSLACGSYEEMLEWSGGSFRNFFLKYPESNAMQQKMLAVSRRIQELSQSATAQASDLLARARDALYAAQCNCAYWHGVFGGLYLVHLRRAVQAHLLAAERLTDEVAGKILANRADQCQDSASCMLDDVDADGSQEVRIKTHAMSIVVDPADGGTLTDWSLYAARINLLDTLSRRYEPYHAKLRVKWPRTLSSVGQGVAGIHALLGVKEEHLETHLAYDDHRRSAFHDYGLIRMPRLDEVVRCTWGEDRIWSSGPFRLQSASTDGSRRGCSEVTMVRELMGGRIRKIVRVLQDRTAAACNYTLEGLRAPVLSLEFNLSVYDPRYLKQPQEYSHATSIELTESFDRDFSNLDPGITGESSGSLSSSGIALRMSICPPALLYLFPIETVSESEHGLERIYQGLCVICFWRLDGKRDSWDCSVELNVEAG